MVQRMDRFGPGRGGEAGQNRRRTAAAKDQLAAHRRQIGGERGQAVMQPPPLRRADAPLAGRFIIEDIDRDDRPRGGGADGSVVGEAKVVPEPDDLWRHRDSCRVTV
jgi:hypothetical protein